MRAPRLELQEKERKMLEQVAAGYTVKNVVVPAVLIGGVGGALYLGYKAGKAFFEWGDDIFTDIVSVGKKMTYGEGSIVSEKTGETIDNPAHGVPIIGGLFEFGMNLGNKPNKSPREFVGSFFD